eukprot:m.133161 g.133161  ORF g.133161 m.133161 type:complete len:413 (+) comp17530_c0_seq2:178-1416(+)
MAPLSLTIHGNCPTTNARATSLFLGASENRNCVQLPIFMPVGTQGTMKGLTAEQVKSTGCRLMLSNTYHLGLRPGPELLEKAGGLHKFMGWDRSLLTDSGGFQMVSLLHLAHISEQGVNFRSPHDGSELLLTPEKSIGLQNSIGADIMMQLDDVVSSTTTGPRVEEAMHRSIRWLDRCIAAHKRTEEQNLFAIIQGGLDLDLRSQCIKEMVKRDTPGVAIGGLSGGEDKNQFWKVVKHCCDELQRVQPHKPRYLMGVGYALDLVVCVALGVDMFDCVFPTRTARFGMALTAHGQINLNSTKFSTDMHPIAANCPCTTCAKYTRAYLHTIAKEPLCCHLLSVHNITYQLELMKSARQAIIDGTFPHFVQQFVANLHPKGCPSWAADALNSVGITIPNVAKVVPKDFGHIPKAS